MTNSLASAEQAHRAGLAYRFRSGDHAEAPFVLLVHGRGGDSQVMWSFNRAIPKNFHVFAPQAPLQDPGIGGWSWWLVDDLDNREASIDRSAHELQEFFNTVKEQHSISPQIILVAGFSQGGALLSEVVNEKLIPCDGLALLSSFVLPKKFRRDLPEIFIAHGIHDEVIPLQRAKEGKELLEASGAEVFMVEDETTHKLGVNGLRELKNWLYSFT